MSEPPLGGEPRRTLFERLSALMLRAPEDREQLIELLRDSHDRDLLDADALSMIEGVLRISELTARDLMVRRAQMDVIDVDEAPERLLPRIVASARSRFPVFEHERDNVIGILLAKDLLRLFSSRPPRIRDLVRPAVFVPETKALNLLLRDLRSSRDRIAIVVDEYGGVAGLVTIADILEQIIAEPDATLDSVDSPTPVPDDPDQPRFELPGRTEPSPAANDGHSPAA